MRIVAMGSPFRTERTREAQCETSCTNSKKKKERDLWHDKERLSDKKKNERDKYRERERIRKCDKEGMRKRSKEKTGRTTQ